MILVSGHQLSRDCSTRRRRPVRAEGSLHFASASKLVSDCLISYLILNKQSSYLFDPPLSLSLLLDSDCISRRDLRPMAARQLHTSHTIQTSTEQRSGERVTDADFSFTIHAKGPPGNEGAPANKMHNPNKQQNSENTVDGCILVLSVRWRAVHRSFGARIALARQKAL